MRRVYLLLVFVLFCSLARAAESPWDTIARYPDDIDVVLVLENPADRLLLGEAGQTARGKLAAFGMFTETERAWAAMADSFGMTPDDGIRALLSRRAVVLWDRVGDTAQNPLSFIAAADDRWVLSAEVDDEFVRRVRKQLKPVPRRIHQGKPVFAIEQGRFQLVIVEGNDAEPTRMIISPRAGSELLDRVLDSLAGFNPAQPGTRLGARAAEIQREVEPGWVLAGVVALDRFLDTNETTGDRDPHAGKPDQQPVMSLVIQAQGDHWRARVASDLQLDLPEYGAPVAMLEAVGGDAVFVMANTSSVVPEITPGSLGFTMSTSVSSGGGSLVVVSQGAGETGASRLVTTVLTGIQGVGAVGASGVDRSMEALFTDPQTGAGPQFAGRFPRAIRTQSRTIEGAAEARWIGDSLQCSWIHRNRRDAEQMLFAIGPEGADTAQRVRWLSEAADTIDAIGQTRNQRTVVSRGVLRPGTMGPMLFGDEPGVLSGLLGTVDRASWELQRASFGVRGTAEIHWDTATNAGLLGRQP